MHALLQDFRFAFRQLRKSPGFALTTILTLALGIGATTAIFSLVNTVLLKPLPFPEQGRLMSVHRERAGDPGRACPLSYPDFFDWRAQNQSFSGMASYHDNEFTLVGSGDSETCSRGRGVERVLPGTGSESEAGPRLHGGRGEAGARMPWCSATSCGRSVVPRSAAEIVGKAIDLDGRAMW